MIMAAKKLYGAAAKAHAKKVARSRKRSRSLTKRGSSAPAPRRRKSSAPAPARRRRSAPGMFSGLPRWENLAAAAAYGFFRSAATSNGYVIMARGMFDKVVPETLIGMVGKPVAQGLVLHFGAKWSAGVVPGVIRTWASRMATAAFYRGADNLGASGLDFDKAVQMSGEDDGDVDLSGVMDADYEEVGNDDEYIEGDDDSDDDPGDE